MSLLLVLLSASAPASNMSVSLELVGTGGHVSFFFSKKKKSLRSKKLRKPVHKNRSFLRDERLASVLFTDSTNGKRDLMEKCVLFCQLR